MLLNLAEDHLDRHGTFEAYRAAKLRGVRAPAREARRGRAARARRRRRSAAAARRGHASAPGRRRARATATGELWWRGEPLMAAAEIRPARRAQPRERDGGGGGLPRARRRRRTRCAPALRDLRRRRRTGSRRSRRVDGVLYVNDSKATNVASAVVGIDSFPGGVHAILGGRGKGGDYAPLGRRGGRARARRVPDRRDGAPSCARRSRRAGVPLHDCGDLERAVAAARAAARPATSCCSRRPARPTTSTARFEERGDHFRALVRGADELDINRRGAGRRAVRGVEGRPDATPQSSSRSSTDCC